jgi:hypothetical protein
MSNTDNDELLPEYDLDRLGPAVRGKYYEQYRAGTNVVLIDPDLSEYFPDSDAVNRALRECLERHKKATL